MPVLDVDLRFAHAIATWALVGLIWTIQLVQYPLFAIVPAEGFLRFHAEHMRRITWVVGPLMLVEALTAIGLVLRNPSEPLLWIGLGLVALLWLVTGLLSVPCHRRLSAGFDRSAHATLVGTNWIRTIAWSARGGLAVWILLLPPAG